MELQSVESSFFVGDDGVESFGGTGFRAEALRQACDLVGVAHPHGNTRACSPDGVLFFVEEEAIFHDLQLGGSVFAVLRPLQLAAEFSAEDLLSVADAEQRFFERKDPIVDASVFFEQAFRSS